LLRIAPALVVCLLVATMLACLFIPPAWLSEGNLKAGLSAFFGLSNLVLAQLTDDYSVDSTSRRNTS
jgi:peptidoglycan/LPS O-acetylase OafA/YrhL